MLFVSLTKCFNKASDKLQPLCCPRGSGVPRCPTPSVDLMGALELVEAGAFPAVDAG